MKKTMLKVMGIVLAIACAPAGAVDPTSPSGTHESTIRQQTLVASAAGIAPQGLSIGVAHAGSLQLPSGANGTASPLHDSRINRSTVPAPGSSSLRSSGTAAGQQGGGYLISVAAVPEPSGGAMLLCGLVVLAFIARRKTQPVET